MKKLFLSFILCFFSISHALNAINIGQHFILSLPKTNNKKILTSWLVKTKPAGVMLTAFHFQKREATKKLVSFLQLEAKKLKIHPLFVAVDWEGGIVSRPSEAGGFYAVPSPKHLSQAGRSACFIGGTLIGSQLNKTGINIDFAPSLDLFDPKNPVLATRCFSKSPSNVIECGTAFAKGLMRQGVIPVIKHFPGLGLGQRDTHFSSVQIENSEKTLQQHMLPFEKAMKEGTRCIMFSHAIVPRFGPKPLTLSPKAVQHLKKKNPKAIFITDDFCMKAIQQGRILKKAALKALKAGFHLIIFSGKSNDQIKLISNLQQSINNLSNKQKNKFELKHQQIQQFKKSYLKKTAKIDGLNEKRLSRFLAQRCLETPFPLPFLKNKKIVMASINLPTIRTSEQWFVKDNTTYLAQQLQSRGCLIKEFLLSPTEWKSLEEFTKITKNINANPDSPIIIQTFFYGDSVWNKIQKKWLEILKPFEKRLVIISLGHPYEQNILPQATILNLGSFHKPLLDVAAERLCQQPSFVGADILIKNLNHYLKNKRFGLLCHSCSKVRRHGKMYFIADVLYQWAKKQNDSTKLAALFAPEHGIFGEKEAYARIKSKKQSPWNCPIHSLHGKNKKPNPKTLNNLDVLLIDLQEVGVRCFTYLSSMKLIIKDAAQQGIKVIILDRPNPLFSWGSRGPLLEKKFESFLGKLYVPFLHGSTIGTLAKKIGADYHANITVLNCHKNNPNFFFSNPFTPPSPNLSSIDHIFSYPLSVFLEGTNYSEGRGTNYPFMQIGAPWVNSQKLANVLNKQSLPGIYFEPVRFIPRPIKGKSLYPKHKNTVCHGVFIHLHDHDRIQPGNVAQAILKTLFSLYPKQSRWLKNTNRYNIDFLAGTDKLRKEITASLS